MKLTAFSVLIGLVVAGVVLIAVEFGQGASSYGTVQAQDPCTARVTFPGGGLDATLQRIALSGLNGAACELHTTREEFVLSFAPEAGGKPIQWDRATIERATRSGLLRAVNDAHDQGSIGGITAFVLRQIIERAPLDWLLDKAGSLSGLFG